MKRKSISKKVREEVKSRTNGRCGYCGEELKPRWQIDHVEPHVKARWDKSLRGSIDDVSNLMASCPQCNNYKHCMSLEGFRRQLSKQCELAMRNSVNYRFGVKYGLIEEVKKDIVFYFETLG